MGTANDRVARSTQVSLIAVDPAGRSLEVRRIGALDRLRLFKALGAVLADNAPYLGMAMLASSVCAIDGVPVPAPVTEGQIEALVQRLGDAGIEAVADCLSAAAADEPEFTDSGN
jgi:hypothetical protein